MSENSRAAAVVAAANEQQAALASARRELLRSRYGDRTLAWLALVPVWTEPLAEAVSLPAGEGGMLRRFLDDASGLGLIERESARRADPVLGRTFSITETDRVDLLDAFRDVLTPDGKQWLRDEAVSIARLLQRHADSPMPDAVRQWVAVAAGLDAPFETARALRREISDLTKDNAVSEAYARVDAGQALAKALGSGPLKEEAQLGARRVEVAYRRASDERHLEHYIRQEDQVGAFDALLADRQAWALHYLGVGGIGKTMLLRDITARLSRERGVIVSRIDFDHLNPEFPTRRPGQLLLALAADFRGAGDTLKTDKLVDLTAERVLELHETLSGTPPPGDPLQNIRRPQFAEILDAFCDLLETLPLPVVLLLDTCEELARIPITAGMLPSLEATFEILQRVHERMPTMRAVFAGRRPLASGGAGWRIARTEMDPRTPLGQRQAVLRDRPFLKLYEIRGLDERAARQLVESRLGPRRDPAIVDAILAGSRAPCGTVQIVGADGTPVADANDRYSPFDLVSYADWLRDDPRLTAAHIAAGDSDPYVDVRIVQRIQNPRLKAALPGIVALGRFDLDMVRPVLPPESTSDEMEALFAELADYEWLSVQDEGDRTYLEVDRQLLPRLRRYFAQPERAADFEAARARLGPALQELVRDSPLSELSITHIDTALAVLAPAEAARLWIEILVRVPGEAGPDWLRGVTERVMSEDGAGERQPELASGFEAARYVVGRMVPGPNSPVPAPLPALDQWPDDETHWWLARCEQAVDIGGIDDPARAVDALTAFARSLTERLASRESDVPHRDSVFATRLAEEEAAAFVMAAEWVAGRLLWPDAPVLDPPALAALRTALGALFEALSLELTGVNLVATASLACARLALAGGDHDAVNRHVAEALQLAGLSGGATRRWLHWRAPESAIDRIRLEVLALQRDFAIDLDARVESWWDGAIARDHTIDGERLASAIIRWRLDRGVIDAIAITWNAPLFDPDRRPWAPVHLDTPPLFVSRAMAFAALGRWPEADQQLRDVADAAERSRRDPETVQIAHVTRLEIACQSRERGDVLQTSVSFDDPRAVAQLRRLQALTGDDLIDEQALPWHERWRTTPASRRRQLQVLKWTSAPVLGEHLTLTERLDLVEAKRMGLRTMPSTAAGARVATLDELLRAIVRMSALSPLTNDECPPSIRVPRPLRRLLPFSFRNAVPPGLPNRPPDSDSRAERDHMNPRGIDNWLDRIGARRLQQIAHEEGELLALRLPIAAERLLDLERMQASVFADHVSRVRSLTTWQLVRAGMNAPKRATKFAELIEPAWTRAVLAGAALPPWSELTPLGLQPDLPAWAVRTKVGLLYDNGVSRESMVAAVDPQGQRVRIPELGPGPLGESPERAEDPSSPIEVSDREEPLASRPTRWRRVAFDAALSILSTGAALPGVIMLPLGRTLGLPAKIAIAVAVGVVAVVLLSRHLRTWLRAWAAARSQATIETAGASPGRDAPGAWSARIDISLLRVRFALWPPVPTAADMTPRSRTFEMPDVFREPYERGAAAVDRDFVSDLAQVRRDLVGSRRIWPVALKTSSSRPWEAVLTPAVAGAPLAAGEPLFIYRTDPAVRHNVARGEWDAWSNQTVLLAGVGTRAALPWTDAKRQSRPWLGYHFDDQVGIVHALGTPVRTSNNRARLRLGDTAETARARARSTEQLESAAMDADLLDRSMLPFWVPLLVLQQTPSETPSRLTSDRDQAALLRAAAAELFAKDCGALLVIPSLPSELAEALIRTIARQTSPAARSSLRTLRTPLAPSVLGLWSSRAAKELDTMARIVRSLRELVLQWPEFGAADDPRREAAWDIVLFANQPGDVSY